METDVTGQDPVAVATPTGTDPVSARVILCKLFLETDDLWLVSSQGPVSSGSFTTQGTNSRLSPVGGMWKHVSLVIFLSLSFHVLADFELAIAGPGREEALTCDSCDPR
ncbi:hypothetical protein CEP51_016753 [Fusarium floridanum]|uniref:Uncharacterized protein n=1 Tax=Fusarium floridanum TaxID=1325733 RepID=A0A428NGP5_9HYPO|nr:hypothetical protein CEP51_016753 [Fusarium floridanum]